MPRKIITFSIGKEADGPGRISYTFTPNEKRANHSEMAVFAQPEAHFIAFRNAVTSVVVLFCRDLNMRHQ
jgi:hypothetical protein